MLVTRRETKKADMKLEHLIELIQMMSAAALRAMEIRQ